MSLQGLIEVDQGQEGVHVGIGGMEVLGDRTNALTATRKVTGRLSVVKVFKEEGVILRMEDASHAENEAIRRSIAQKAVAGEEVADVQLVQVDLLRSLLLRVQERHPEDAITAQDQVEEDVQTVEGKDVTEAHQEAKIFRGMNERDRTNVDALKDQLPLVNKMLPKTAKIRLKDQPALTILTDPNRAAHNQKQQSGKRSETLADTVAMK